MSPEKMNAAPAIFLTDQGRTVAAVLGELVLQLDADKPWSLPTPRRRLVGSPSVIGWSVSDAVDLQRSPRPRRRYTPRESAVPLASVGSVSNNRAKGWALPGDAVRLHYQVARSGVGRRRA